MQRRYDIDDFNECVAWVAAFFTVIFYVPKIAPFINILQGMVNFEDTPGFHITVCYINCFFWCLYGELLFNDQQKYGYLTACIICLISMGIYLVFEIRKYFLDSLLNFLILVSSSWGLYRYLTVEFDDDVLLGRICVISSILVYLFNIYNIYRVIKVKNFNLIHINNTIIHLIANLLWLTYGVIDKDRYISSGYGIGIIISLIEIIVYQKFKKKYPSFIGKNNISTIGIENIGNEEPKKEEMTIKLNEINEDIQDKVKEKPVKIVNKLE